MILLHGKPFFLFFLFFSQALLLSDNRIPLASRKPLLHKKAREQGKSEKAIKAEWERIKNEACARGTKTHNGIEDAIKDVSKFKEAIKYLTEASSGRVITIADIPNLPLRETSDARNLVKLP